MQHIVGEFSIVVKMDVADLEASAEWYEKKLELVPESEFNAPGWRQLKFSDIPNISVGLHNNPNKVGSGGEAFTIVVKDLECAREQLLKKGVEISDSVHVGKGVNLAYFDDPDGNHLVLREQSNKIKSSALEGCL